MDSMKATSSLALMQWYVSRLLLGTEVEADFSDPEGTVQDAFQECFADNGLRGMRQVQIMG